MRHAIIFATIIALSPIVSPEAVADSGTASALALFGAILTGQPTTLGPSQTGQPNQSCETTPNNRAIQHPHLARLSIRTEKLEQFTRGSSHRIHVIPPVCRSMMLLVSSDQFFRETRIESMSVKTVA